MNIKILLYYGFAIGCGALLAFFIYLLQPINEMNNERQIIHIERGTELGVIAHQLEDVGLIRSAVAFQWYSVIAGGAHAIKPGFYNLSASDGAVRVLERLIEGGDKVNVRIAEGTTLQDIDAMLGDALIIEPGALAHLDTRELVVDYPFLKNKKSLEGFLFPDTYQFTLGLDPIVVARKMLDNFVVKAYPLLAHRSRWYDDLIRASLIEKEVPADLPEDQRVVSGIMIRRLKLGMGLQIDATVIYAECGGRILTCKHKRLSREDFKNPSPYNTYIHAGLPPTPIANMNLSALKAAITPRETAYVYYLSDPETGRTIFSKDLDEHNNNRAKYLGI